MTLLNEIKVLQLLTFNFDSVYITTGSTSNINLAIITNILNNQII